RRLPLPAKVPRDHARPGGWQLSESAWPLPRRRARWVLVVALALIVVAAVLIILISGSSAPTTGYDASYPQCSGSYPPNPLFGIVGVNGWRTTRTGVSAESCAGHAARRGRNALISRPCR